MKLSMRNLKRSLPILSIGLVAGLLSGCGQGFQSAALTNGAASGNSSSSVGSGSTELTAAQKAWQALDVSGNVFSGQFGGEDVVSLDKTNMQLLVRLPMPVNPYLDGVTVGSAISKIPGATLMLEPRTSGGSSLVLRVPLSTVINGIQSTVASKLPNGDVLPQIAAGQLPAVSVQLTKTTKDIKATLYAGTSSVGIFVNTPFDPFLYLSVPIKNADESRTWGYMTSVPAKTSTSGTSDGGFFISITLPSDVADLVKSHL